MNTNNQIQAKGWSTIIKRLGDIGQNGIGLKCPFCGEKGITSIGSGIVQLRCFTRIVIEPNKERGLNVVTLNGHAVGFHSTPADRYPYKEFNCKA